MVKDTWYVKKVTTGDVVAFSFKPNISGMPEYMFVSKKEYTKDFEGLNNLNKIIIVKILKDGAVGAVNIVHKIFLLYFSN